MKYGSPKTGKVIGLKSATSEEIEELHKKYPLGFHKTHLKDGTKIPNNGIFYTDKQSHMRSLK